MIRLLNAKHFLSTENYKHPDEERSHQQRAPYVIISHVWRKSEVVYEDVEQLKRLKASQSWEKSDSAAKIDGACKKVIEYSKGKVVYLWLDTVCIDKQNPAELSSSINSMYQWYKKAEVCFAYLDDYPTTEVPEFTQSKWFTRGWTLQELVAPRNVIFFDKHWREIGDKERLQPSLTSRTKINGKFLLRPQDISRASIGQRMSWFSGRKTTVPEDMHIVCWVSSVWICHYCTEKARSVHSADFRRRSWDIPMIIHYSLGKLNLRKITGQDCLQCLQIISRRQANMSTSQTERTTDPSKWSTKAFQLTSTSKRSQAFTSQASIVRMVKITI